MATCKPDSHCCPGSVKKNSNTFGHKVVTPVSRMNILFSTIEFFKVFFSFLAFLMFVATLEETVFS